MTTEPTRQRRPRWWPFSLRTVRGRITLVVATLMALALAAAGLLVYTLESSRIERVAQARIDQEQAEFRAVQRSGNDGKAYNSGRDLLVDYVARNVPDEDEMLIGYVGDTVIAEPINRIREEVLAEPAYLAALRSLGARGGSTRFTSATEGEVWVTAVPVRGPDFAGSLVMVNFLKDSRDELNSTMRTYSGVALGALLLTITVAAWQLGQLLGPLDTLRRTARQITAHNLSGRIPEQGNDDITELTRSVNTMLDRLEAGFEQQRRFLDDAGHELRTPLTVIGGHLELVDADDANDVRSTQSLVLDEVDRMSRLVNDLIMLAKTRRPDFVRPAPVNLGDFLHTTLEKARTLGQRTWTVDADPGPLLLELDEQRLTQAMLQLADNAVKHTDVDDVIAFGARIAPGNDKPEAVVLWVRDSGDGIPAEDRERIFDRFSRSDTRSGDDGFGLGLSIVAAIVHAHGGMVRAREPRGGGCVIEMRFPRTSSATSSVADRTLTDPAEERGAGWHGL